MTGNMPGNAAIRRNRCSIGDAQYAMNDQQQVMSQPLFAWYELVR